MEYFSDIASLLNSTFRISTPLIFAAMAGLFAERSGVIDFSLEGKNADRSFCSSNWFLFFWFRMARDWF